MSSILMWSSFVAVCALLLAISFAPRDFEYENELTLAYVVCLAALILTVAYKVNEKNPKLENRDDVVPATSCFDIWSHRAVCCLRVCGLLRQQILDHDFGLHAREQEEAVQPERLLRRWVFVTSANTICVGRVAATRLEPIEQTS